MGRRPGCSSQPNNFWDHPFGSVQIRFSSTQVYEKYSVKRIREVCSKEECEKVIWGKKGRKTGLLVILFLSTGRRKWEKM